MQISAHDIAVARGEDTIIDDLSFVVSTGEALVVTGENGAGKSTLLRAIAGFLPLQSGTLQITDPDPDFADTPLRELCHHLGPDNAMKPAQTVEQNLTFWQNFCGNPHLDIIEALEFVGLDGLQDVPFGHLSTGQRRRIAIARLLVSFRPVWLLDEPTSGLDAQSQGQFAALMRVHLEDDGIIIAATHMPLGLDNTTELKLTP
ncbi:heme ABC exporter ATP-binding protein CcmA [Ahrensia sp. R2A130]|uniref:heme ABC exporter ATP-binding protein CcmA n=1 Tax=Ahrensia sp. R2A130 TaxID=744979 RepID=UPI0001E0A45F|nr:heme ABC exporter ATP-binding protein CcmA [Ahrensia sp. R2A130]EFL89641.1 heme ABC exporter, ATP-binding protein CcmA [Ahrensia sp. R2A130]